MNAIARGGRGGLRAQRGAESPPFHPLCLGALQSIKQQLWAHGSIFVQLSVFSVCRRLGESLPVFSRAAHRSSFSSSWILVCLLPQRKKKKGHVCLEKYVGQWNISCTGAKGEEGSGGGEGVAEWSSSALLATAPSPRASARVGDTWPGPFHP